MKVHVAGRNVDHVEKNSITIFVRKIVCERRHVYFNIHIVFICELRSSAELRQCDCDGSQTFHLLCAFSTFA